MGFLQGLFKSKAALPPFQPPAVPMQLPKITAPTAAQIARLSPPGPAAQALLTPQQTPAQYLAALQEKHLGEEMVKTLAHGLPDREGVQWAALSAEKVSDKLPATDVQAMQAAQAWVKNPNPATQAAAAAAAAKTDFQGPGALAAQAAAWTQPLIPEALREMAATEAIVVPHLTPGAVSGAVLLAAAIAAAPKPPPPGMPEPVPASPPPAAAAVTGPPPTIPPEVQAHTFKAQHPFIAMGLDIASGKTPVG